MLRTESGGSVDIHSACSYEPEVRLIELKNFGHEGPSIGKRKDTLESGHIVTMEPGLYYRGLGGVRIEDTVVVRDDGYENLTTLPKVLEV